MHSSGSTLETEGIIPRMVRRRLFDLAISIIVVANSATIGLEQSHRLAGKDTSAFDAMEHVFLVIYIVELGMRVYEGRMQSIASNWVRFDFAIVSMGVLTSWVFVPIYGSLDSVSSVMVLRTARVLRLARMLKLVVRCRELLMLVQGLLNSMSTMVYTFLLCIILLYVVGCMSLELIPLSMLSREEELDPAVLEVIHRNFSSLPAAMLSLIQFITFDNISQIYTPLIDLEPMLAIFFMSVILVVGIVFMNLVTAAIVNSGLEQAMQDKDIQRAAVESTRKKLILSLKQAFYRADTDHSGEITREELQEISPEDQELLKKVLGIEDLLEIFDCLDVDGDGEISIEEFCKGMERIVSAGTSAEMKRMERLMQSVHKHLRETTRVQDDILQSLQKAVASVGEAPPQAEPPVDGPPAAAATAAPSQMPAWAGQLVAELRELCAADVRRAVDEARASFAELVRDDTMPPAVLQHIPGATGVRSSSLSPRVQCEQREPQRAVVSQQGQGPWIALPRGQQLRWLRPLSRPSSGRQLPAALDSGHEGKPGPLVLPSLAAMPSLRSTGGVGHMAPSNASGGPAVPESGRPALLCCSAWPEDAIATHSLLAQPLYKTEEL